MSTPPSPNPYRSYRFPAEIISHAVWLYLRFCLTFRDVEGLLFERGVVVTYEAIRKWCRKFGHPYAKQLRRRRPRPGDKWQTDEGSLTIQGKRHYLWRAGDQEGNVLDILVQRRRDKRAAKRCFRKLLKGVTSVPRVIITDKLKSYGAANWELLPGVGHRQHRYLNNRAENSHQPAGGSDACSGSNHPAALSVSSRPTVPSRSTSAHAGMDFPRLYTAKRCGKDSGSGERSQSWLWPPERHKR